jgi:hypothetical protein
VTTSCTRDGEPEYGMEKTVLNLIVTLLNLEVGTGLQKSLKHTADDDNVSITCYLMH